MPEIGCESALSDCFTVDHRAVDRGGQVARFYRAERGGRAPPRDRAARCLRTTLDHGADARESRTTSHAAAAGILAGAEDRFGAGANDAPRSTGRFCARILDLHPPDLQLPPKDTPQGVRRS